ncbi:hypothetical protein AA313_de0204677 [Arthrobotrys entomopaga]|nr:hypothetical protein AA313_de0204677 [Arthrobotrys entomopaga]
MKRISVANIPIYSKYRQHPNRASLRPEVAYLLSRLILLCFSIPAGRDYIEGGLHSREQVCKFGNSGTVRHLDLATSIRSLEKKSKLQVVEGRKKRRNEETKKAST